MYSMSITKHDIWANKLKSNDYLKLSDSTESKITLLCLF